jgi:hypothetical protein
MAGAALTLTLGSASAQTVPDWLSFQGPVFTVDMPRPPAITTESNVETAGDTIPVTKYLVDEGAVALIVMDADFTGSPDTISVDGAVQGMLSDGRVMTAESVITLDGHEGRSAKVIDKDGFQIGDLAFVIGRHFYQVLSVVPKDATAAQSAEVARFAQSFHFTVSQGGRY